MTTELTLAKDVTHGFQKNSGIMQIGVYIAGRICEVVMPNGNQRVSQPGNDTKPRRRGRYEGGINFER